MKGEARECLLPDVASECCKLSSGQGYRYTVRLQMRCETANAP